MNLEEHYSLEELTFLSGMKYLSVIYFLLDELKNLIQKRIQYSNKHVS